MAIQVKALHGRHLSDVAFWKIFHNSPATLSVATSGANRLIEVNHTWSRLTGYSRDEAVGHTPIELGLFENPEDFHRLNRRIQSGGGVLRDEECRFRTRNGTMLIGSVSAQDFEMDGEFLRIVAVENITPLRRSQEALARVTRELIRKLDQERLRIARHLHDDLGQRVALLQIGIEQLTRRAGRFDIQRGLEELVKQTADVAADLRSLAHDLHSSKLGLRVDHALRRLCSDVGSRLGLTIRFTARAMPREIGEETSSCLFHVLQEALTNVAKHSGSRRAEVELWGTADAVHLRIQDFGTGFSTDGADTRRGLGLLTMSERAALVSGTVQITSTPQLGTRVRVRIPLAAVRDPAEGELMISNA